MSLRRFLIGLGLAAGGAALLWPGDAAAAPRGYTIDEDELRVALARLRAFIAAARIDATATDREHGGGRALRVVPGKAFVREDALVLPRRVDGLDVEIVGWPR